MITIENVSKDHITLNAYPAPPITLATKGAQYSFKDERAYVPYQFAVSALMKSGKLSMKKEEQKKSPTVESAKPQTDPPASQTVPPASENQDNKKSVKNNVK